ncbi:MAG: hypothetical protein EZS28_051825, partial [Streblomastix strix]
SSSKQVSSGYQRSKIESRSAVQTPGEFTAVQHKGPQIQQSSLSSSQSHQSTTAPVGYTALGTPAYDQGLMEEPFISSKQITNYQRLGDNPASDQQIQFVIQTAKKHCKDINEIQQVLLTFLKEGKIVLPQRIGEEEKKQKEKDIRKKIKEEQQDEEQEDDDDDEVDDEEDEDLGEEGDRIDEYEEDNRLKSVLDDLIHFQKEQEIATANSERIKHGLLHDFSKEKNNTKNYNKYKKESNGYSPSVGNKDQSKRADMIRTWKQNKDKESKNRKQGKSEYDDEYED